MDSVFKNCNTVLHHSVVISTVYVYPIERGVFNNGRFQAGQRIT